MAKAMGYVVSIGLRLGYGVGDFSPPTVWLNILISVLGERCFAPTIGLNILISVWVKNVSPLRFG